MFKKFFTKQINDIKSFGLKEIIRKFILFLIYFQQTLLNIIIGFIPVLIMRLISSWYLIRIQKMPVIHFANFACDPAVYYCKKKLGIDQPNTKFLDLFYISNLDKIYNRQLAKMWKKKFIFLNHFFLQPIDNFNRYFPGWNKHTIELFTSRRERDIHNLFERLDPLKLSVDEELEGERILKKMGINKNDKFVILAIRDKAYEKIKIPSGNHDWSHNDFRNFDINDFLLAAEELAKKGYYVIRTGVKVEKQINSQNSKIIDYANSEFRSDFMDVYLASKCFFCISSSTGISDLCLVYNKPAAMIISPVGDLPTFKKNFIFLTKKHFSLKNKKNLSLNEIFSYGLGFAFETKNYKDKNVELVNHSPEEIKDFVLELEEIITNKKQRNKEDLKLQEKFKSVYGKNIKKHENEKNKKLPKMHNIHHAFYSSNFLKSNSWWLE